MKCSICQKEFSGKRKTAKFCSTACRVKASRVSVTSKEISVTKKRVSVTKPEVSVTDSVAEKVSVTSVRDNWYMEENKRNYNPDPLKRITIVTDDAPSQRWLESTDYKNLMEELDKKPLAQLEREGYWIPVRKYPPLDKTDS